MPPSSSFPEGIHCRRPIPARTAIQAPTRELPAHPPVRPALGSKQTQLILFLVVGIASIIGGALLLPGAPNRARPVNSSAPQKDASRTDSRVIASAAVADDPSAADPNAAVELDTGIGKVKASAGARKYESPSVAPRRRAGRASDLAASIDQRLDGAMASANLPASPLSDDAEFLRRAYLDLIGQIPSQDAAVTFLDNQDPYKRANLIEELLASPEFGKHFAQIWADILIKRDLDNNRNLKPEAFTAWLAEQFNQGIGWDKIVSELLTATGKEDEAPQTFFYLANQDNNQPAPDKLVASVGNLFMGIQIQCAQCHVHPFVGQWRQQDFWGMAAFFGHTRLERDGPAMGNKKNGVATVKEVDNQPLPRGKPVALKANAPKPLPAGAVIAIPDPNDTKKTTGTARARFFEGDAPILGMRGPYRPALAEWLTAPENKYFATAMVNRLWAHSFARGFVNPLEDMNDKNQPSHPELLQTLAREFGKSGFDLKLLLRAIANTNAYQRTSRPLASNRDDEKLYSHMPVKVLGARELLNALAVATGHQEKGPATRGKQGMAINPLVRFFDTRDVEDDPTEFTQGIPQMLRLMNTNLTNASAGVAARIVKGNGGNPDRIIEDLYLITLSRRPHPSETKRMLQFVGGQGEKGYAGVLWALLNSAEFASNR